MSDQEALRELLLRCETCLHKAEVRRSPAKLDHFLDKRFVEFGSSGEIHSRDSMIAALYEEEPIEISIQDFKTLALGPDVILVTYRARISETDGGASHTSLRSSVWKLSEGNWRMVFHQGTPTQ